MISDHLSGCREPGPGTEYANQYTEQNVKHRFQNGFVRGQLQRIHGKGRKCRERAEKSGQQTDPHFVADRETVHQQYRQKSRRHRTEQVDRERPVRKGLTEPLVGGGRDPVTRYRAQRTAHGDSNIDRHFRFGRKCDIVPAARKDAPESACVPIHQPTNPLTITRTIKRIGLELGFQQVGITDVHLDPEHARYRDWIARNYHGEMGYMARNVDKRLHPERLVPDTLSVICVRLDYLVDDQQRMQALLDHPSLAYVSRYALGRDYHKLMRKRLQKFADRITARYGEMGYRVFTDSAPVLEKPLAAKAGIGWQGKHSNLLHRDHGSWFFLGEIYTDIVLDCDTPVDNHCGRCTRCIDVCPTAAIVEPYLVDARRCISYLTIEHRSEIPIEFRAPIGNRIYGCDDCQLVCPWNRFARLTREADFAPRHGLDSISLLECYRWSEDEFLRRTEGSAIRRIGHQCWLRNIVIALGNASPDTHILDTLKQDYAGHSGFVQHHLDWAIQQQESTT